VCALTAAHPEISQVIFHIDTYNDEPLDALACPIMPTRREIRDLINTTLERELGSSDGYQLQLYYTPKRVDVEVRVLPAMQTLLEAKCINAAQLKESLRTDLKPQGWLHHLELLIAVN
jgi:hypothetical protein